jgi:hypothetical protein
VNGELAAIFLEEGIAIKYSRVCTEETIPFSRELEDEVLPNTRHILDEALKLM